MASCLYLLTRATTRKSAIPSEGEVPTRRRFQSVGGDRNRSVSYYVKGAIVGLLLDVHIRRLTGDRRNFDDVMRAAYRKYGGERGFRPEEFEAVASEIAGADLSAWFDKALRSTAEMDYAEMLEWYGLRFVEPGSADPARAWQLEMRPDSSTAQRQRLERWLAPTREPGGGKGARLLMSGNSHPRPGSWR